VIGAGCAAVFAGTYTTCVMPVGVAPGAAAVSVSTNQRALAVAFTTLTVKSLAGAPEFAATPAPVAHPS